MNTRTIEKLQALRERLQHFRLQQDSVGRAFYGDKLAADANALLHDAAAGLTPNEIGFVKAVEKIAEGAEIDLPELPDDVAPTHLAEPARNAPMPDRIVGLLCAEERAELEIEAAEVPQDGREKLAGLLGLERASEGNLVMLSDAERAAARLHLDRQTERAHVARLSEEARANGETLQGIAESYYAGPGAPHLRGF